MKRVQWIIIKKASLTEYVLNKNMYHKIIDMEEMDHDVNPLHSNTAILR